MPPMPGNEKANPNVAMNEATAIEQWQQAGMAPNYIPLLSKDFYGNDIAEPDLSNPTRSRHERPLDTIRSFEMAAYGKEFTVGDNTSEAGMLNRGESRQSMRFDNRRSLQRNSSTSTSQMQRNYSYGNMQESYDDTSSEIQQAGPSRTMPMSPSYAHQPSASNWDNRNPGYSSPHSESGRAQFTAPVPQKLSYAPPPTPPQETKPTEKKKGWGKRLSFGKNKA